MEQFFSKIKQILNIDELQEIQDVIAKATGLAIITVDYSGRPLTKHSCVSAFCDKVRHSKYGSYCEKCDSHGGIEAARLRAPYIYFCHAGLVDFAIPFWLDGQYLGAFMGGQILLDHDSDATRLETILPHSGCPTVQEKTFQEIPVMSLEHIEALANMLMQFGTVYMKYSQLRYMAHRVSLQQYFDNPLEHRHLGTPSTHSHDILSPAIKYIYLHSREKITVSQMAALCGISSSYFSKLFAKEYLCSLSQYVNRIRMEQAIHLLNDSDLSIREISEKTGFEDCGYFIKVFKQHTGKTPSEYRKSSKLS